MATPLEQILEVQPDMFGSSNPQMAALCTKDYDEFYRTASQMHCTCCQVGPSNNGSPPVLSRGPWNSKIVIIGEAPGELERRTGVPFVGKAGSHLRWQLAQACIPEDAVFFLNILKCRPTDLITNPQNPLSQIIKDRKPQAQEAKACMPLLLKQLSFTKPKVILLMGGTAAVQALGLNNTFKILRYIGYGIPLLLNRHWSPAVIMAHPSYCLRNTRDTITRHKNIQMLCEVNNAIRSTEQREIAFRPLPIELFSKTTLPIAFKQGRLS